MHDVTMRTTLTIDDDVAKQLKDKTDLEDKPFKEVVNNALRIGLGIDRPAAKKLFRVKAHSSAFLPNFDLARLNQLADDLEVDSQISIHN